MIKEQTLEGHREALGQANKTLSIVIAAKASKRSRWSTSMSILVDRQ